MGIEIYMALKTTVLGAYPKPDYVPIRDWFTMPGGQVSASATQDYDDGLLAPDTESEALFVRAAAEVIADQAECGIDIVTDGEVRRENYIHYHCRHLNGVDFTALTHKVLRDGAYETDLPTVRGDISPRGGHFLPHDFAVAQASTDQPVKVTLPGPMTISDTTADAHYGDPAKLGADLARALNYEIRALVVAGCRHIQVDEPLFARKPAETLEYGVENLNRCFEGIDDEVIGDFGLVGGGAAGLELDRADVALGTPHHALVVARSEDHSDGMLVVLEELTSNQPVMGDGHPKVHADITFLEIEGGGAVFSTGSIAFAGALPINGYDNNIARLMGNVMDRFLEPAPFEGFDASRPPSLPIA